MLQSGTKLFMTGAAVVFTLLLGCESNDAPQGERPPVTVEVVEAQVRPLVLSRDLPGRIEPVRVAEVRARVA